MRAIGIMLAGCLLLASGGCTGTIYPEDGGGDGGQNDTFLIQSLALEGTTREDCTVTVDEVPDEDGAADQAWQAAFRLSGGAGPGELPEDTGTEQSYTLRVKAVRGSDGQEFHKKVTVHLYD